MAEAERIFAAAPEPKEFWAVEGAAHVDPPTYQPEGYKERVLTFLGQHLQRKDGPQLAPLP